MKIYSLKHESSNVTIQYNFLYCILLSFAVNLQEKKRKEKKIWQGHHNSLITLIILWA